MHQGLGGGVGVKRVDDLTEARELVRADVGAVGEPEVDEHPLPAVIIIRPPLACHARGLNTSPLHVFQGKSRESESHYADKVSVAQKPSCMVGGSGCGVQGLDGGHARITIH